MVTRKSAMLSPSDRQEVADLFSVANIKAEARLMNSSGIGHGEPDGEYLVTTGSVASFSRAKEVRKEAMVGDYLDGYETINGQTCKVYARKTVYAQSEAEAVSIATRQAMGIRRQNKVPEGFITLKNGKKRAVYANEDDILAMGQILRFSGTGYSAQAIALKAENQQDHADAMAKAKAEHDAKVSPIMEGYKRVLAWGDNLLIKGYKAELRELGVKV